MSPRIPAPVVPEDVASRRRETDPVPVRRRTGRAGLKIVRAENGSFLGLSDATAAELADLVAEKAATA